MESILDIQVGFDAANATEDMTAKLPDELLCLVLDYLSLSDKLRLEAFNSKFKRCVREVLRSKPQALEIDLENDLLNGHKIINKTYSMLYYLHTFCPKAKFDRVAISTARGTLAVRLEQMDQVLPILFFSSNDCLSHVTTLELDAAGSPSVLHKTIIECPKLKTVRFNFKIRPLNEIHETAFFVDLHTALGDKALTEVKLTLYRYSTENVIDAFGSLAPSKLQKIDLTCDQMPALDLGRLVNALRCNAWAALQEVNVGIIELGQLNQLTESDIGYLPQLQKCYVKLNSLHAIQFVPTLALLFASHLPIAVSCQSRVERIGHSITNAIRQLQAVHEQLQVKFSVVYTATTRGSVKLVVESASFEQPFLNYLRCIPACVQCRSFYPIVLDRIGERAGDRKDRQLLDYQLDRCRVGNVVGHLNTINTRHDVGWEAVSATLNEAQDQVIVTFDRLPRSESEKPLSQFRITVARGHCLNIACTGCLPDN